jgi:hypothetical protein
MKNWMPTKPCRRRCETLRVLSRGGERALGGKIETVRIDA